MTINRASLGVNKSNQIGKGGFGIVYRVSVNQLARYGRLVYKEYKSSVMHQIKPEILQKFVDFFERYGTKQQQWLLEKTAWPFESVQNGGQFSGYLMPEIPDSFYVSLRVGKSSKRVPATMEQLCQSTTALAKRGITISPAQQLALLADFATILVLFHNAGIIIGDLSPKNVLFTLNPQPAVFLVDCDSFIIHGKYAVEPAETPGFEVPRGQRPTTPQSDIYKFSLLALRVLAQDLGVSSGRSLPKTVDPALKRVIQRGISKTSNVRPTAKEFRDALIAAARTASTKPLTPSPTNSQKKSGGAKKSTSGRRMAAPPQTQQVARAPQPAPRPAPRPAPTPTPPPQRSQYRAPAPQPNRNNQPSYNAPRQTAPFNNVPAQRPPQQYPAARQQPQPKPPAVPNYPNYPQRGSSGRPPVNGRGNYAPQQSQQPPKKKGKAGKIAGIVIGVIAVIGLIIGMVFLIKSVDYSNTGSKSHSSSTTSSNSYLETTAPSWESALFYSDGTLRRNIYDAEGTLRIARLVYNPNPTETENGVTRYYYMRDGITSERYSEALSNDCSNLFGDKDYGSNSVCVLFDPHGVMVGESGRFSTVVMVLYKEKCISGSQPTTGPVAKECIVNLRTIGQDD